MNTTTLHCVDCGNDFEFSEGEQQFFAEKKWTPPIRCLTCRAARRDERNRQAALKMEEE